MVRIRSLEESLHFYCDVLGLTEIRRIENESGRFTLIFLAASEDKKRVEKEKSPLIELTFNWDSEVYEEGRNFGHLAFEVDNIYDYCNKLAEAGITINCPPRDGYTRSSWV